MNPALTHATCDVNGESRALVFPTHRTLLEVLREECGLTGTKHGCELGECGACAVLLDGQPVLSCLVLAAECDGRRVDTIEGLRELGALHPLQAAFADLGAAQCGYCTPGILMVARALLDRDPDPDADAVREALSGNLCRCTGYDRIVDAVLWAASVMRGDERRPPAHMFHGNTLPEAVE